MSYASIFILSFMTAISWGLITRLQIDRKTAVWALGYALLWTAINPDSLVASLFSAAIPLPMLTLLFALLGFRELICRIRRSRTFDRIFIALSLGFMLFTHAIFIGVYQGHLVPAWLGAQIEERQWVFESNESTRLNVCANPDFECIDPDVMKTSQAKRLHDDDHGYSVWLETRPGGAFVYTHEHSSFALRDPYTSEIAVKTLAHGYSMLSLASTVAWLLLGFALIAFHRSKTREFH